MTREDLTFRKDMAKGTGCFEVVKELLRDPLLIAPLMDWHAQHLLAVPPGVSGVGQALVQIALQLRSAAVPNEHQLDGEWMGFGMPLTVRRLRDEQALKGDPLAAIEEALRTLPKPVVLQNGTGVKALEPLDACLLRRKLPADTAMHDVVLPPLPRAEGAELEARCAAQPGQALHVLAQDICLPALLNAAFMLQEFTLLALALTPESFPTDAPLVRGRRSAASPWAHRATTSTPATTP
jgi:hypothetical protein